MRLAQGLLHHCSERKISPGSDPLGLLQSEALEIPRANKRLDSGNAVGFRPSASSLRPNRSARLIGFPELKIHAFGEQLQTVAPIIRAHVEGESGKLRLHEIDNACCRTPIVHAHAEQGARSPPRPHARHRDAYRRRSTP